MGKRVLIFAAGVTLSFVLPLSPLLSASTSALTGSDVAKQTQAWQILAGIQSAPSDNFKDTLTSSQLNSCDFIKEDYIAPVSEFATETSKSYALPIGYTASGGDGMWQAGTPSGGISNSFEYIGVKDCSAFGKALGYTADGANYKNPGTGTIRDKARKLGETFAKKIGATWGSAPNYIRYQSLINAFEGGACKASYRIDYISNDKVDGPSGHDSNQVTENQEAQKNGDTGGGGRGHYYIWSDRDGAVKQNTYYVDSDTFALANAGYGLNLNESSVGTLGCTTKVGNTSGVIRWWLSQHKELADDYLNKTKNDDPNANPNAAADGQVSGSGGVQDTSRCKIDGIGWIVCPVVYFLSGIADGAYSAVSSMLTTPPVDTRLVTDGSNPLYSAWSMMRSFANVAFVIAFVIIIYSQLTGGGIGNYTIKKMLPRLIVAAILVNISYWICAIAVDLSNILGASLKDLFGTLASHYQTQTGSDPISKAFGADGNGVFLNIAGIALVTVAAGAVALVYPAIFLPILIAALAAIVAVLITLTMRAGLIIMLVVASPLAFVAYLLPNTESLFKRWYQLFQVLLLMNPVIAGVFGICAFAAKIIMNSASGNVFVQIMGAGVLVVPLLLVPALMKVGGGLLTRWAGVVNNPNKGAFDRMRGRTKEIQANSAFMRGIRIRKQARQSYRDGVYARRLTGEGGNDLVNKLTQARSAGVSGAVDYGTNKANESMAALKAAAAGTAFEGAVNATATGVNKAGSIGSGQRKAEADALRRAAQGAVAEAARKEVAEAREVLKQTTTVDNAKTKLLSSSSTMSDVDVEAHIDFILSEGGENEVRAIAKDSSLMANHGIAAWRAIRRNDSNIRGKHKDIANFASNNGGQNITYDPATRTQDAAHYTDTVKGMQASQLIAADPSMLNQPVVTGGTGENYIDKDQARLAQGSQAFSSAKPGTQSVINRAAI